MATNSTELIPRDFFDGLVVPGEVSGRGRDLVARADEVTTGDGESVGLFFDEPGGSRNAGAWDISKFRAQGSAAVATAPVDPITTVLALGSAARVAEWLDLFFPPIQPIDAGTGELVSNPRFQYPVWGLDHLGDFDTRLAEHAPFQMSGLNLAWQTDEIEQHGWAAPMSDLELARSRSLQLDWARRKAQLPEWIVRRRMEFIAYEMLTDTTADVTYATGNVVTLAGGAEWDNGGDSRSDITTAIAAVANGVHVESADITVILTHAAFQAALSDAGFVASRSGVAFLDNREGGATVAMLRDYWGVGRVEVINPTGTAGAPLFSDQAWVLTHGPDPERYDTTYGHAMFAARFAANDGFALEPWLEQLIRTWVYAFVREYKMTVLQPAAAYLIQNTSAAV